MSNRFVSASMLCVALLTVVHLSAHHSAVLFDVSKIFTLAGTITRIDWRNPHVGIFVDVKGDGDKTEPWEFETGAPSWFRNRNLAKSHFEKAIGQRVIVEAVRARDGSSYGYIYRITFADGRTVDLR